LGVTSPSSPFCCLTSVSGTGSERSRPDMSGQARDG
jgi:hypothetical protein